MNVIMEDEIKLELDRIYVSKEIFIQNGVKQVRYDICHPEHADMFICDRNQVVNLVKDLQMLLSLDDENEHKENLRIDKIVRGHNKFVKAILKMKKQHREKEVRNDKG